MFVLPLSRTASRSVAPHFARAVDRLFDDSLDRYFGGTAGGARTPALDVSETDGAYIVAVDGPGVTRAQVKVSVEGRRVSLETREAPKAGATDSAASADTTPPAAPRALYRERSAARYARTVSLPAEVDQGASQAKFENGVLTLTLAKKVATGATRLSID